MKVGDTVKLTTYGASVYKSFTHKDDPIFTGVVVTETCKNREGVYVKYNNSSCWCKFLEVVEEFGPW